MLAAGIVLDTFAGEAGVGEGGEEEMTGGYFYRYLYCSGPFLSTEFLSQHTNMRMRIRNVRTYTYIHLEHSYWLFSNMIGHLQGPKSCRN